ncbi:MAG: hypothetical protein AVDCRST_MAG20-2755, partial [uncultured Acidimicrobiales bacterium]
GARRRRGGRPPGRRPRPRRPPHAGDDEAGGRPDRGSLGRRRTPGGGRLLRRAGAGVAHPDLARAHRHRRRRAHARPPAERGPRPRGRERHRRLLDAAARALRRRAVARDRRRDAPTRPGRPGPPGPGRRRPAAGGGRCCRRRRARQRLPLPGRGRPGARTGGPGGVGEQQRRPDPHPPALVRGRSGPSRTLVRCRRPCGSRDVVRAAPGGCL